MRAAGKTIFLSSHLLSEVESICDRVAFMRAGRVISSGRTTDLLESRDRIEVVATGLKLEQWPSGQAMEEGLKIVVPRTQAREVVERIWQTGGEIVRVNPVRRSLEQVFVELTGDSTSAGENARGSNRVGPPAMPLAEDKH